MWTACGWSPKEIGKASTRISSTAISFPNYSNAYECRKYRAGVVRRQRDYPVRIWKPAQRLHRIRPPKKLSIMSIALCIAGRKAPRGGRFYDRSSALSGHRKIHRRQQGPVQYFGHRCFLKKIVERNSHGFRYLRKNGYFAIVTWGYFWKKRSDSFGFQDNGFRKTTPESQVKGHRG